VQSIKWRKFATISLVVVGFLGLFAYVDHSRTLEQRKFEAALQANSRRMDEAIDYSQKAIEKCNGLEKRIADDRLSDANKIAGLRAEIDALRKDLKRIAAFPLSAPAATSIKADKNPYASDIVSVKTKSRDATLSAADTFISDTMVKCAALLIKRKYHEASEGFHAILRIDSRNAKAAVYSIIAEYGLDPRNYDKDIEIVTTLNNYLNAAGEDAIVLNALAVIESDRNNWGKSAAYYGRLVESGGASLEDCTLAGYAAVLAGDVANARRFFDIAISKDSTDPKLPFAAGKAFERAKYHDEAAEYYTQALNVNPKYELAEKALASLHSAEGDKNAE
jgi:tetratricopeptide (TPR) repeat protein